MRNYQAALLPAYASSESRAVSSICDAGVEFLKGHEVWLFMVNSVITKLH